jgi:hypothetical protein
VTHTPPAVTIVNMLKDNGFQKVELFTRCFVFHRINDVAPNDVDIDMSNETHMTNGKSLI